jgi:hypothetical protein
VNSTRTHVIPHRARVTDLIGEQGLPIKALVQAQKDMTVAVPETCSRRQVVQRRGRS